MKKIIILLLLAILSIFVVSCQVRKTDRPTTEEIPQATTQTAVDTIEKVPSMIIEAITMTPTQSSTVRVSPTRTQTPLPMPSLTIYSWERVTPNGPVPLSTAKANVAELLKTNGGCSLPCWWGIEPAETSYTTAFNKLSFLTSFIAVKKSDESGSLDAEFRFPVPETISSRELTITYKVEHEIIQLIEVNPGQVHQYRFSQLLKDYGDPEEVWVEGLIDPTSNNPFTIFFYYRINGIVATFWVDATDKGDKLQVCPGSLPPTILILWEPDGIESFIDFTGKTYDLAYVKKEKRSLISLEQATEQTLVEISESNCFETPKESWPAR
jgi:hypothetical protein